MSHQQRIKRLLEAAEAIKPPSRCPSCGGPKPGYDHTILVRNGKRLGRSCPECGLLVDEMGKSVRGAMALRPGQQPGPRVIVNMDEDLSDRIQRGPQKPGKAP